MCDWQIFAIVEVIFYLEHSSVVQLWHCTSMGQVELQHRQHRQMDRTSGWRMDRLRIFKIFITYIWNGGRQKKTFHIIGPLCREPTWNIMVTHWFPSQRATNAELWFICVCLTRSALTPTVWWLVKFIFSQTLFHILLIIVLKVRISQPWFM